MRAPFLVSAPTPLKRSSLPPAPARPVTSECAGLKAGLGREDLGSPYVATKGFDFAKVKIHSPVTPASLRSADIQAKLSISSPGDAAEQEADQIADQVLRMPTPGDAPPVGDFAGIGIAPIQRKATASSPSHASEKEADHVAAEPISSGGILAAVLRPQHTCEHSALCGKSGHSSRRSPARRVTDAQRPALLL